MLNCVSCNKTEWRKLAIKLITKLPTLLKGMYYSGQLINCTPNNEVKQYSRLYYGIK